MNIEIVGLIATSFVAFSFICNGELLIRFWNSVGSILFVIYGLAINAWSVALLNSIVIIVNIYKIYKLKKFK